LVAAQGYIHHLETKLHKREEQLKVSQAHATKLQDAVEQLQELILQELEELEEIEGISGVEDN
jgi:hypothetical protein